MVAEVMLRRFAISLLPPYTDPQYSVGAYWRITEDVTTRNITTGEQQTVRLEYDEYRPGKLRPQGLNMPGGCSCCFAHYPRI